MPSRQIDIPCDDIFKYDRLGLEPAIVGRTHALLMRSPQAIAIDGQWGTGKSTFLALWAAYLRSEEVKVVTFNAWKSFEADPFASLTKEILRQVDIPKSEQKSPHKSMLAFLRKHSDLVAQGIRLVSVLQPGLEEVAQVIETGVKSTRNIAGPESIETTAPEIQSPEDFASLLSCAAQSWSERPTVVMIDELDRCSPEYTVDMLQLLEHAFCAEHVVFVVAVNQSELVHSIRSFYGEQFNAEGYLERFFDDVLSLPMSNRLQYIESSLSPVERLGMYEAATFLHFSSLSLREIDKSIEHLKSVAEAYSRLTLDLLVLWIARSLAPSEYRQFISGKGSDKTLVDAIFSNRACGLLRADKQSVGYHMAQRVEATVIAASCILPRGTHSDYDVKPADRSELFRHYQEIVEKGEETDGDVSVSYAKDVIGSSHPASMTVDQNNLASVARMLDKELPPDD